MAKLCIEPEYIVRFEQIKYCNDMFNSLRYFKVDDYKFWNVMNKASETKQTYRYGLYRDKLKCSITNQMNYKLPEVCYNQEKDDVYHYQDAPSDKTWFDLAGPLRIEL